MTPIEIFEYKRNWSPGYEVRLHSDLRRPASDYCKVQMMKHQWDVNHFTNVYEDTWRFENRLDAQSFAAQWESRFVNQ
jgi:hypothetical protein